MTKKLDNGPHKSIYFQKLCDLDRDLKQTAYILSTQKFPHVGYVITVERHTFATLRSSNVIALFQCKVVSSTLFILENECVERIPILYRNKLQFVDHVSFKTFPWYNKAPCKSDNFDQQTSLVAEGGESYRLTP